MAFKKRLQILEDTQVNITSEYGRAKNSKKRTSCSIVINGLLMTSLVLGMTVNPIAVDAVEPPRVNMVEGYEGLPVTDAVDEENDADVYADVDGFTDAEDTETEQEFNQLQESRLESKGVKETKLAGTDRYKTAVEISKAGWSTTDKALLVNGKALPDALCASPLADEYNAPILLTEKDSINADTLSELKRLGVKEITVIGSEGVISKAQVDSLVSQGFKVERIGGVDRYDTSLKIANKLKGIYQAKGTGARKVAFIANGVKGLADATSVSSPAGIKDAVILYSNGSNLNGIKGYIEGSTDEVYIIGGETVISKEIEAELRRTNKKITRIAGTDRKDTNAKVIKEFFPEKDISNVYVAKDGMGAEDQLVDGLAVGSLASKNKVPVILASDNLGKGQEEVIKSKKVSAVTQVGDGKNATATKQVVGIINAIAQPEPEDGMKLPTLTFAKEQSLVMSSRGGYQKPSYNTIEGTINVKYGDSKTVPHSYGSKNVREYEKVLNHVKDALKDINFRLSSDWVYLQHFLNNGNKHLEDSFIDPVLQRNGMNGRYKDWRVDNKHLITGLQKGIVSRADAEKLMTYNAVVSHVSRKTPDGTVITDASVHSAYEYIFEQKNSCQTYAQFLSSIGDVIGMNTMVAGSTGHVDVQVQVGNYWWVNGRTPGLNKTDNVFQKLTVVEAPTYNMSSYWK